MKKCNKCLCVKDTSAFSKDSTKRDGLQTCCKACKNAVTSRWLHENKQRRVGYMQVYRRKEPNRSKRRARVAEYRGRNREKHLAHVAVRHEIVMGRMTSQPCEVCREVRTVAHHDDYTQRLSVRWLCAQCHKDHHKRVPEQSGAPS